MRQRHITRAATDIVVGTFLHHFEGPKRTTWIVSSQWADGVTVVQVRSRAPRGVFLRWSDIAPAADFGDRASWCVAVDDQPQ